MERVVVFIPPHFALIQSKVFFYKLNRYFSLCLSVRVVDGKLYHPDGVWDLGTVYVAVYSKREC